MYSDKKETVPVFQNTQVISAENRAWDSFYHSGKVEDYIRYAQLKHRDETGDDCAAGVLDAGKDPRVDY